MVETNNFLIIKILSKTSSEIAEGEIEQLGYLDNFDIKIDNYLKIISAKTAALFSSATQVSGLLANCSEKNIIHLEKFGYYFGMIFQLIDDVLDYIATEEHATKTIGNDFKEKKITLPIILLKEKLSSDNNLNLLLDIFAKSNENNYNQYFDKILVLLNEHNIIQECKFFIEQYANKATFHIEKLTDYNMEYYPYMQKLIKYGISRLQ